MNVTVDILGTPYKVVCRKRADDRTLSENLDWYGYTSPFTKTICVCDLSDDEDFAEDAKKGFAENTARHEIIHAYLAESGLDDSSLEHLHWAQNEEMIDWFARQWHKIDETISAVLKALSF